MALRADCQLNPWTKYTYLAVNIHFYLLSKDDRQFTQLYTTVYGSRIENTVHNKTHALEAVLRTMGILSRENGRRPKELEVTATCLSTDRDALTTGVKNCIRYRQQSTAR
jgi:hypothetical protein